MPRELIAIAAQLPKFREYKEQALRPGEVRICSTFSSVKHGTELRSYRANTRDYASSFDHERRIHIKGKSHPSPFPIRLGNITIGVVIEVSDEVTRFHNGDRVFGYLPIRETHTVSEDRLYPVPKGMSPEAIVYSDPACVALLAVRDARICLGDRVAVFGLGAIGQMAVQIARLQGARWIVASDPIALRRKSATHHSANMALNPLKEDTGLIIKDETQKKGVDISLETSGSYSALNDALRATTYGGTIVSCAYYIGDSRNLHLEGEWHRNHLNLISTREASQPLRDNPRWNISRIRAEAFELLKEEKLSAKRLVTPIVSFNEADKAYREIDETPEKSIKLGIIYPE